MGQRDLRRAMVEAAQTAVRIHDHWQAEYKWLQKRLGNQKAKVMLPTSRQPLLTTTRF